MDEGDTLTRLEGAAREERFCEQCGAPTALVARKGYLWLECTSLREHKSRLQRLLALDLAAEHTRHRLGALPQRAVELPLYHAA
jgi:hypothetical protein